MRKGLTEDRTRSLASTIIFFLHKKRQPRKTLRATKMRFSERMGAVAPRTTYQKEEMDDALRNSIWNILSQYVFLYAEHHIYDENWADRHRDTYARLWSEFYKLPIDTMGNTDKLRYDNVREAFFSAPWHEVYDLVEYVVRNLFPVLEPHFGEVLETEKSAYRFIDSDLVAITDDTELKAVEFALQVPDRFSGSRQHIRQAVSAFSKRPVPDYRTAVKEAISAVESVAKIISGKDKATLKDALKAMDDAQQMHPAFKMGLEKLYAYTSDEGGIRHAMLDDNTNVGEADAHFMIVVCSAFVNFMVARPGPQ